jgi:predicted amidohydrolase YtcJ
VIEHGYFATPPQLRRAARLGVWLSTQPAIAQVEDRLISASGGTALGRAPFPLRSALSVGVGCALGSDWNATPGSAARPFVPLETIRIATGQHHRGGLDEDEVVDIATAMHLHTRAAAELAGCSDRGAIHPGALADLVVLSTDPVADLAGCRVLGAVVDGRRLDA